MTLDGPLLDLSTAAALLGISKRTLRRLAACGAVPVRRMGRLLRFLPADIARAQANGLPSRTEIEARRPLPRRGRPNEGVPSAERFRALARVIVISRSLRRTGAKDGRPEHSV